MKIYRKLQEWLSDFGIKATPNRSDPPENVTSGEALERKMRSEAILAAAGVPINNRLPGIETSEEARTHPTPAIVQRAICLLLVSATMDVDRETIAGLTEEYGVGNCFTKGEQIYLETEPWPEGQTVQFSWRVEAAWTLLWALGYVEELGLPTDQISPAQAMTIVKGQTLDWLASNAEPRAVSELLDEADLIYRCRWAIRDADLKGNSSADMLDFDVTNERHLANRWLIDASVDWDDVDTSA